MATDKLPQKTYPVGHGPDDFQCFGPPATKDAIFADTRICDMGCFHQREDKEAEASKKAKDSNKYYHAAVVQSKIDKKWYCYIEYGRVGQGNPSFQFSPPKGTTEGHAVDLYVSQCESKNTKRGTWEEHRILGSRLVPKKDSKGNPKDLYVVRPQATRATGLPDARTIKCDEGAKQKKQIKKITGSKKSNDVDSPTVDLMRSLNVATVKFARGSMADASIPTQSAIDKARDILAHAIDRVSQIGDHINQQVGDKELKQLTRDMYGMIPKKKDRGAAPEFWILSQNNIRSWQDDLDAFESALYTVDLGSNDDDDPFGGMKITMRYLPANCDAGEFIREWMPKATRNVHGGVGNMRVKNVWEIDRHDDRMFFAKEINKIAKDRPHTTERPLHQPAKRQDLDRDTAKLFIQSNTAMLFHGTRSVNVSGILRESLRLPRMLRGVHITAAMFGGGIYWADDWKKSAGYTSLSNSLYSSGSGGVPGRGAFMFVADVVLGKPHVASGPHGYTAPPSGHHSVFGKAGHSRVQNNEWIVYNSAQNRLRYLVEFETSR